MVGVGVGGWVVGVVGASDGTGLDAATIAFLLLLNQTPLLLVLLLALVLVLVLLLVLLPLLLFVLTLIL